MSKQLSVCVVLFDDFELLDAVGPIELLSHAGAEVEVAAPVAGEVRSGQGVSIVAPVSLEEARDAELILVPGGLGTRRLVRDSDFLGRLTRCAARFPVVASVCTGSALLAMAGLLDGYRATSNKAAFEWVRSTRSEVDWVPVARWVHDRDRWTSSGVAAGIDMTHALIAHLVGLDVADRSAVRAELEIHRDPEWDPFAAGYGLTSEELG